MPHTVDLNKWGNTAADSSSGAIMSEAMNAIDESSAAFNEWLTQAAALEADARGDNTIRVQDVSNAKMKLYRILALASGTSDLLLLRYSDALKDSLNRANVGKNSIESHEEAPL